MRQANASDGGRAAGPSLSLGVSEDLLVPTTVLPVQFLDLWSRSGGVAPARRLAVAVLREALNDLTRYRFARRRRPQRLYSEAYAWVASDDRAWPFSFVNLCEVAGLSVEAIRRRALDPTPPRRSVESVDAGRVGKAA